MKLLADIDGEKLDVRVRREAGRVFAEIDGRAVEMEVREGADGSYLLIRDGRVYVAHVSPSAAQPERQEVRVRGRVYSVALSDPKRLRASASSAAHADGSAQIVAQMPGKVVRVQVEAGAQVEAGDPILVVEAMKMQNEMKSPKAGTVASINTKAGATVNAGDVLAVIE
ncbi:MAG TPA: biotin/lipoyl-containing protein [Pyrinomonadaceae bacterium]|nr:biotin/lipoyl-containing protein [Pyrinomonadaceae bacterium]